MARTLFRVGELKAIVFDVDGTLYRQTALRRAMVARLLGAHLQHPVEGWRTMRILRAYRRAQEHLRGHAFGDVAAAQLEAASRSSAADRASVRRCVEQWMEQEPLNVLPRFVYSGVIEFLHLSKSRGLKLAVFSDYPSEAKLRAMGILDFFDVILCAQAPEVGAFKPHPRGLEVVLNRLQVSRRECVYVGDRADVDAAAAAAANVACVIVSRKSETRSNTYVSVSGYEQLQQLLFGSSNVTVSNLISAESLQ